MNQSTDCPEIDYFMNEDLSDVVFVVEGQRIPAMKLFLCMKNRVFRAMFSDNFKESKDKTVVIEETSFEAFKTLIHFLYSDRLVLEDGKDLYLIKEVCVLSDRYDSPRLLEKVGQHLMEIPLNWNNFNAISNIAFIHKINELMPKMMRFIENNFNEFVIKEKNIKQLIELNDSTHNKLLELLANNYRNLLKGKCETCNIINLDGPDSICKMCNRQDSDESEDFDESEESEDSEELEVSKVRVRRTTRRLF